MKLRQICIELHSPSEYKNIQELLFDNGCYWNNGYLRLIDNKFYQKISDYPIWLTINKSGSIFTHTDRNCMTGWHKKYKIILANTIIRNLKLKQINEPR